jgi:5-carboxyvanillate decarboxylase
MSMNRREFLESSSKLVAAGTLAATAASGSKASREPQPQAAPRKFRLVDTEVHFDFPDRAEAVRRASAALVSLSETGGGAAAAQPPPPGSAGGRGGRGAGPSLFDDVASGGRVAAMDKAGVDFAVLSVQTNGVQDFAPGLANSIAIAANDYLADAIQKYPTRYGGFASFAPQDPAAAAKEIDRAITKLKLNGILVNGHTNGEYLDLPKFWPIFEAAEAVKTPVYIHPRVANPVCAPALANTLTSLAHAPWGYPTEVSCHCLRMMLNGVLDRFPNLQIIIGHDGEGLPWWHYRIDYWTKGLTKLKKKPSEYLATQFTVTTSGMNHHPSLKYIYKVLGPDRIMFASDYPYQPEMIEASTFMNTAPMPPDDVEKMAHGTAEKVLGVPKA